MRTFKDAPMACTATNDAPFLSTLTTNRTECIRLLEKHEHETPDRLWHPGDPQARFPKTPKAKACMKLVLNMTTRNNKPEFPPRNTRLSDELVYLATKFLKASDRARQYPYDFDNKGDIDPARIPSGVSPIVWAHGLPFFPVYKGYYILCGRQHAKWIGWLLNRKQFQLTKQFPMWTVGPVVASASAVELTRTVDRQVRVHKALSVADVAGLWEKNPAARDVVSTAHLDLSVVPTFGDGYRLMSICWVAGYNIRCGPDWEDGRAASFVGREAFQQGGVEVFDYDEAREVAYANERCPDVDPDDSDSSESGMEDEEDERDENEDDDLDNTVSAGLQDQDHHQNAQESDAHENHGKTLDDEESGSDFEAQEMMVKFIRKLEQESLEPGEGHRMHETQNQAKSSVQKASNKNNISMGTQIVETVPTVPINSTTENATANAAHAKLLDKLSEISERTISSLKRAMAEYKASQGSGDLLLRSAKRRKIFTAETDEMVSIIEGGRGRISAEIHTDQFSTIIIDRSGLEGDDSQGPISRFKRTRAENDATEECGDILLPQAKRRMVATTDTEDEVMSTAQECRGRISAEVYAEKTSTNIADRLGPEDNNIRGIFTSFGKRRAEWKPTEAAEDLLFPSVKRQKKTVRFIIDEGRSTFPEGGGSASAEVQADQIPTSIIDHTEQADDMLQ